MLPRKVALLFEKHFINPKTFEFFFYFFAIIFESFDKKFHEPLIPGPVGLGDINFKIPGRCFFVKIIKL